jgi:hypothetical protein
VLAGNVLGSFGGIAFGKATQKHCDCVETDIPQPSRFSVTPSSPRETTTSTRVVKPALVIRKAKRLGNLGFKGERTKVAAWDAEEMYHGGPELDINIIVCGKTPCIGSNCDLPTGRSIAKRTVNRASNRAE